MKNTRTKMIIVAAASAGMALGVGGAAMAGVDGNSNSAVSTAAPVNQALVQPHIAGTCNPWAVVGTDATLYRTGCAGTTTQKLGLGRYQVTFTENVRKCAYIASLGGTGKSSQGFPGFINVVSRSNNKNAIYVATEDSGASNADESFHVMVAC